jgi:retron-type reverse transcriptase
MSTGDAEQKAERLELDLWWSRRNLREHGIESASRVTVKAEPRNAARRVTMEVVVSRENMLLALRAVERNQGAAGVDGMTTGQLRRHLQQQWEQIKEQLLAGTYQPHLVRRVDIPKPGGGMRMLGIPTVSSYCT